MSVRKHHWDESSENWPFLGILLADFLQTSVLVAKKMRLVSMLLSVLTHSMRLNGIISTNIMDGFIYELSNILF